MPKKTKKAIFEEIDQRIGVTVQNIKENIKRGRKNVERRRRAEAKHRQATRGFERRYQKSTRRHEECPRETETKEVWGDWSTYCSYRAGGHPSYLRHRHGEGWRKQTLREQIVEITWGARHQLEEIASTELVSLKGRKPGKLKPPTYDGSVLRQCT